MYIWKEKAIIYFVNHNLWPSRKFKQFLNALSANFWRSDIIHGAPLTYPNILSYFLVLFTRMKTGLSKAGPVLRMDVNDKIRYNTCLPAYSTTAFILDQMRNS